MSYSIESITQLQNYQTSETNIGKQYKSDLDFAEMLSKSKHAELDRTQNSINELVKPSPGYFAEKTGIDYKDALDMVYGVVGSNKDTRDWSAIMSSDNPLETARAETAQMISGATASLTSNANFRQEYNTMANTDHLAVVQMGSQENPTNEIFLTDGSGKLLRNMTDSPEQIGKNLWLHGQNTDELGELSQKLDTSEFGLKQVLSEAIESFNKYTMRYASESGTATQSVSQTSAAAATAASASTVDTTESATTAKVEETQAATSVTGDNTTAATATTEKQVVSTLDALLTRIGNISVDPKLVGQLQSLSALLK